MPTLGLDIYSLRSQGWTPFQQLDFCAKWGVGVVHYSEFRLIGGLEPDHLLRVRDHADRLGIALELGMLSMCPSSGIFDASQGTAEAQLLRLIEPAHIVGSPFIRCVVGNIEDRRRPGGIEQRIDDAVRVIKSVRQPILDAGLKLAVENHGGDMQARELKGLIEEAGTDLAGVCIDAGNSVWTIEDPHLTLETLAPYVLTSHTRDTAVWRTPEGAAFAWTRMGEGNVRIGDYLRTFIEKCPGRALSFEIIVMPQPKTIPYRDPRFWDAYRRTPAWEFVRFENHLENGPAKPVQPRTLSAALELEDVESSLRWTKELLAGLS